MKSSLSIPEGSGITIDPQLLEPKFLHAGQALEQMIADRYIPGVDAITDKLVFTGKSSATNKIEAFLTDVANTWDNLIDGTFQESLMPSHEVVRNIFLAYSSIFDEYGENMRKLALKSAHPLNISIFHQIYQQSRKRDSDQDIADSLQRAFFEPNGEPGIIFTTNSILIKNLCITTVNYISQECQKILAEGGDITPETVASKINIEKAQNPFLHEFLPMLNGNPTNTMMGLSTKYLKPNERTDTAIYISQNGQTINIKDFSEISSHLSTSAKKLMDVAVLYLTSGNFYRASTVNPTAIISLMDYWRAQGFPVDPNDDSDKERARCDNNIKRLKNIMREDCKAIMSISYNGFTGTGKNKTQEASFSFISGWRFLKDNKLKINFDIDLATYLVHAYQMQFPTALLSHDNRNANSYAIGRKIALHHSMDNNAAAGTNNTISVRALLETAPEIPTYDTLVAAGRRDWKVKIKGALESSLNNNISVGYLSTWQYRDPSSKPPITYTAEEASLLTWDEYSRLVIDFTVKSEPEQETRRAKKAIKAAETTTKRKRGRPRKTPAIVK